MATFRCVAANFARRVDVPLPATRPQIVDMLLKKGADCASRNKYVVTLFLMLHANRCLSRDGKRPIDLASHPQVKEMLLAAAVKANKVASRSRLASRGRSLLLCLLRCSPWRGWDRSVCLVAVGVVQIRSVACLRPARIASILMAASR